jgi:uridylate kinase
MGADVILKATKVDGVYDSDPQTNPGATRYETVSFDQCIENKLGVMDVTAFSLCMENDIPIIVFELAPSGNIQRALCGERIGTIVSVNA